MRERVWGSPDVGRVPGWVRMQGTLPRSIWKRGMWRSVATQVRTHRKHVTQEMRRFRQDAQAACDARDASLPSEHNTDTSDAGSVFPDVSSVAACTQTQSLQLPWFLKCSRRWIAHGGSRKHRLLGTQELVFRVVSVTQQGVIEASHSSQEDGALQAGYVGYIESIHDIESSVRLARSGQNPRHATHPPDVR